MLLYQKLMVLPEGNIQTSSVSYTADTITGAITYQYDLHAKVGPMPIAQAGSGVTSFDPSKFLSANLKVGDKLEIGPVSAIVSSIVDGRATCSVTLKTANVTESGIIVVDVTGPFLKILSIHGTGQAKWGWFSADVPINAVPA